MTAESPAHPWAEAWLTLADALSADREALRGRMPRVTAMALDRGHVSGRLRQTSARVRTTRIQFRVPHDGEWRRILEALARWPQMAGHLLAGDAGTDLGHALIAAGFSPAPNPGDLQVACLCGDRLPCRHAAVLAVAVAARIADAPLVALTLNGLSTETAMAHLTAILGPAAASSTPPPTEPLTRSPEAFWAGTGPALPCCAWDAPDKAPASRLEEQGPPPFWADPEPLAVRLEPVYAAARSLALKALETLRTPSPGPSARDESEDGEPFGPSAITRSAP